MENNNKIDFKSELRRKLIHLTSILVPAGYYFVSKPAALILAFFGMLAMIEIDQLKKSNRNFAKFYTKHLGSVLRSDEKNFTKRTYTGGTYMAIGVFVTVFFFEKPIALGALTVMIVCDSLSALVGKSVGRIRIFKKTLEGSLTFFLSGLPLVLFVFPRISAYPEEVYAGVIALFLTTVVEVLPLKLDDNILIPVSYGFFYSLLFTLIL